MPVTWAITLGVAWLLRDASCGAIYPVPAVMTIASLVTAKLFPKPRPPWHACCSYCGYDLRGLSGTVCPECGQPV